MPEDVQLNLKLKRSRLPQPNHNKEKNAFNYRKLENPNSEAEATGFGKDIIFEKAWLSDEFIAGMRSLERRKSPKMRIPIPTTLKKRQIIWCDSEGLTIIYGCVAKSPKTIKFPSSGAGSYSPNAFTSRIGDGWNDTFISKDQQAVIELTMDVFNTAGERIYSTNQSRKLRAGMEPPKGRFLPASNVPYNRNHFTLHRCVVNLKKQAENKTLINRIWKKSSSSY